MSSHQGRRVVGATMHASAAARIWLEHQHRSRRGCYWRAVWGTGRCPGRRFCVLCAFSQRGLLLSGNPDGDVRFTRRCVLFIGDTITCTMTCISRRVVITALYFFVQCCHLCVSRHRRLHVTYDSYADSLLFASIPSSGHCAPVFETSLLVVQDRCCTHGTLATASPSPSLAFRESDLSSRVFREGARLPVSPASGLSTSFGG